MAAKVFFKDSEKKGKEAKSSSGSCFAGCALQSHIDTPYVQSSYHNHSDTVPRYRAAKIKLLLNSRPYELDTDDNLDS